jgi:hypothetical protein
MTIMSRTALKRLGQVRSLLPPTRAVEVDVAAVEVERVGVSKGRRAAVDAAAEAASDSQRWLVGNRNLPRMPASLAA